MAVTAQNGIFSFATQTAKGTAGTNFHRHRASDIDLDAVSDDRLGPPEVGGIATPTIPYRAGVMAAGGATINPRLESTIGWLLEGSFGACTTTANRNVFDTTVTGLYMHEFGFDTNDSTKIPFMTLRKFIPGTDTTTSFGQTFDDCKLVNLTFALPNDGLISARVDAVGKMGQTNYTYFTSSPSWTYAESFEDYPSIPIGTVVGGYLKVPTFSATALPITAATVTLTNAPLDVRQEKIFGSPYLEDVTVIGRALTIDLVCKWKDPQLYRAILTGTTTGTVWTATPYTSDLDVYSLTSANAGTTGAPYAIRVQAQSVMLQVVGGLRLAGNNAVMLRVTGTALANNTYYAKIRVQNLVTNYTWTYTI